MSEVKFKVGDRVRPLGQLRSIHFPHTEVPLTITSVRGGRFPYLVCPQSTPDDLGIWARWSEIELVESPIQKGDRVKLTLEGEVTHVYDQWLTIAGVDFERQVIDDQTFSVEKIEPPVEQFGPGDYVRDREGTQVFLITMDGYVQVKPIIGPHNSWGHGLGDPEDFTSEAYERVEFHEVGA